MSLFLLLILLLFLSFSLYLSLNRAMLAGLIGSGLFFGFSIGTEAFFFSFVHRSLFGLAASSHMLAACSLWPALRKKGTERLLRSQTRVSEVER